MRFRSTIAAALVIFSAKAVAADSAFTFAVPEVPSRISLGIFDRSGKLVRTLTRAAAESDFGKDLNGFRTSWDGLADDGSPAPPGSYEIRGWAVPETVSVEGDAFLFNDWMGPDGVPPVGRPERIFPTKSGFFLVGKGAGGGTSIWESSDGGPDLGAGFPVPATARAVAGSENRILFQRPDSPELLVAERSPDGIWQFEEPVPAPANALAALSGNLIATCSPGSPSVEIRDQENKTPGRTSTFLAPPTALALVGTTLYASDGKTIWGAPEAGEPAILPSGDAAQISALAPGPDHSLWIAAIAGDTPVVRQLDSDGTLLRELKADSPIESLSADAAALRIFLIETRGPATRALGLMPAPAPASAPAEASSLPESEPQKTEVADWEIFLDASSDPELAASLAGKLPDGSRLEDKLQIVLDPNPLDPSPRKLTAKITLENGAFWIEDRAGLPLIAICAADRDAPAALASGPGKGEIRAILGREIYAESFAVKGLHQIVEIDAGQIER